jgi:hypothetical protein
MWLPLAYGARRGNYQRERTPVAATRGWLHGIKFEQDESGELGLGAVRVAT